MQAVTSTPVRSGLHTLVSTSRKGGRPGEVSLAQVTLGDDESSTDVAIRPIVHSGELMSPEPIGDDDTLDELLDGVRRDSERFAASARTTVLIAISMGERLKRLRKMHPHGSWIPFVAACLPDISYSTVNAYINLADKYGHLAPEELEGRTLTELLGWNRAKGKAAEARELLAASSAVQVMSEVGSAEPFGPQADGPEEEVPETIAQSISGPQDRDVPAPSVAHVAAPDEVLEEDGDEGSTSAAEEAEVTAFDRRVRALEIRAQLTRPEILDRDVRAYDKVNHILIEAIRQIDTASDDCTKMSGMHEVGLSYRRRLVFAAGVQPPESWELCSKCNGKGVTVFSQICGACAGQGYIVKHAESGRFVMPPIAPAQ
jgi:hypothetical protein